MRFVDIKNAKNLDVIPADVKDEGLKRAYEGAEKHTWTKEELLAYDYASMRRQDERGKTKRAVIRAIEEKEKITVIKMYEKAVDLEIIAYSNDIQIEKVKQILKLNG